MKPNKARLREWVRALRSGKYAQGRACLRGELEGVDSYCCLGVACDVFHRKTGEGAWEVRWAPAYEFSIGVITEPYYLPAIVADWFGLGSNDPVLTKEAGGTLTAVGLNDNGASFKEIADFIEQRYQLKAKAKRATKARRV